MGVLNVQRCKKSIKIFFLTKKSNDYNEQSFGHYCYVFF
jgi:hypothetical protein